MKRAAVFLLGIIMLVSMFPYTNAAAASTLSVDLGTTLRPVTHCASGSLYGITETIPANISALVAPLKPGVFTNPARAGSGYQQPIGAAIPVAGRLSGTTGKVMIRLADIFPGWPYNFSGMTNWLNSVRSVIADKKASGYSNFYGYEIWNEPDGTWKSSNGSFENMWSQTFSAIRAADPGAKIIGPSYSYYNHSRMSSFLTYCKANNCLPDIICWHELSSNTSTASNLRDYRALETSLGIAAIPISINEYCDTDHAKEGAPGPSARFIAKFERYKVDSACITWWWTGAPGRLGSLLASNTQKGAGWWFYKWYGDMSGNMVSVTPPNDNSDQVDGFACVDDSAKYVSLLFGGINDGSVNVVFRNIPSFIGANATVKVEKVSWTSKDTVSAGPLTVTAGNYPVTNGQITVPVTGCNGTDGYRVYITPGISNTQVRYEAEKAAITEANISSGSNASEGRYVAQIDYNDTTMPRYSFVDFTVNVPTTKTYTMTIRYANGTGSTATQGLAYNNGSWSTVNYPATAGWGQFGSVNVSVNLKAGINIIRLAKGSPGFSGGTGYAELDYIEIN